MTRENECPAFQGIETRVNFMVPFNEASEVRTNAPPFRGLRHRRSRDQLVQIDQGENECPAFQGIKTRVEVVSQQAEALHVRTNVPPFRGLRPGIPSSGRDRFHPCENECPAFQGIERATSVPTCLQCRRS